MPTAGVFQSVMDSILTEHARRFSRSFDDPLLRSIYAAYNEPMPETTYSVGVDVANMPPLQVVHLDESTRLHICGKCHGTGIIEARQRNDWNRQTAEIRRAGGRYSYPCDVCNRNDERNILQP